MESADTLSLASAYICDICGLLASGWILDRVPGWKEANWPLATGQSGEPLALLRVARSAMEKLA
jgi:hypothetical protein